MYNNIGNLTFKHFMFLYNNNTTHKILVYDKFNIISGMVQIETTIYDAIVTKSVVQNIESKFQENKNGKNWIEYTVSTNVST